MLASPNLTQERLRSLDPSDMLGKTLDLPAQIRAGLKMGTEFIEIHPLEKLSEVDWCGLGGSAVAGDLLQGFGFEPPPWPLRIRVLRYPRPSSAKRITCSYSGNTIETICAFEEVPPWQVWMAISSGGRLQELAVKTGVPHLAVPSGYPPRAAVGFTLGAMIAILHRLYDAADSEALQRLLNEVAADADRYRVLDPSANPALALAARLVDHTVIVYTAEGLTMPAVALRFAAQLAENSKVWSHTAHLPELAHNEIEAVRFLSEMQPPPVVILLGSWNLAGQLADPRPSLRALFDKYPIAHLTLDPFDLWGASARLEAGLRMLLLLDAASVYLALLRAVDPMEIPTIKELKTGGIGT